MKKGVDFTGISTVFFCHDGQGNILMHKRSQNCRDEQGNWDIGGGGLEFGLSPEENLRKEIMEEYGVEVIECSLLGHRNVNRKLVDGTPTHWIAFDYLVLVDRNKIILGDPDKMEVIEWFTLDNLPESLHSQLPFFLADYRERLRKAMGRCESGD